MHLTGERKDAARLGTLCHDCRELIWQGCSLPEALKRMEPELNGVDQTAQFTILMTGYYELFWKVKPIRNTERDNEVKVWGDIGVPGVKLTGRCDGVIPRPNAPCLLYELKTTSVPMKQMEWTLRYGTQVHLYMFMLEQMGCNTSGCVAEVVKKPFPGIVKRRRPKGEKEPWDEYAARCMEAMQNDTPRFFKRIPIKRNAKLERESVEAARGTALSILGCIERDSFPAARGPHCYTKYGECEYMSLCWYGKKELYETKPYMFDGVQEGEKKDGA